MTNGKRINKEKTSGEIDCFSCGHFFITHQAGFPYGCRAAGFKSRALPSREMFANSGMVCQLFTEKEREGGAV